MEVLVYMQNRMEDLWIDGSTNKARLIKRGTDESNVILITDSNGGILDDDRQVTLTILNERIITGRPVIRGNYQFIVNVPDTGSGTKNIRGSNYVIKKFKDDTLSSTQLPLGSGIVGTYNKGIIKNINSYNISCSNPYFVQDKEHYESIILASHRMNFYLDNLIHKKYMNQQKNCGKLIQENGYINIYNLWEIVFLRTENQINQKKFRDVLIRYLCDYFKKEDSLQISTNNEMISLPINYVMNDMGYDALICLPNKNPYNNICISYVRYENSY